MIASLAGDRRIRIATAIVVVAVAVFAAIVSFTHIYDLARHHGQDALDSQISPLSVDGLILAASLVMLHEARRGADTPRLARALLWLGIVATLAANVGYGIPFGPIGALVSAWPAVAFVGAVEMLMGLIRSARGEAPRMVSAPSWTDAQSAALEAYSRSVVGGNPLSQNQLANNFRLTRNEVTKVIQRGSPQPNGHKPQEEMTV